MSDAVSDIAADLIRLAIFIELLLGAHASIRAGLATS